MKPNESRLLIEIDKNLHHSIKKFALDKKMTIKNWILLAIAKQMHDEDALKETNE